MTMYIGADGLLRDQREHSRYERRHQDHEDRSMQPSKAVFADRSRTSRILELAQQLNVYPLAMDALQRGTSFAEFEEKAIQRYRHRMSGFQIRRLLEYAGDPNKLDGFEREQAAEWGGEDFRPGAYRIPWAELVTRDLNVTSATAGGFMVNTDVLPASDILRPWSVTARAGINIVENCVGNQTLPKVTGKTTIAWLPSETTAGTPSQPTLGQVAATPKIAIGLCTFSRQLSKQSNAEAVIRRELLKTAATAIDAAVLAGSGTLGAPLGIVATPGVGSVSGSGFDRDDACAMRDAVATANGDDERISFIGGVDVRTLLAAREVVADTGRYVWDGDRLADRAARVSTDVPTATLVAGDWQHANLFLWGSGVEFQLNPYTAFSSGGIQARVLITCDVALTYPAAFSVSTSVS